MQLLEFPKEKKKWFHNISGTFIKIGHYIINQMVFNVVVNDRGTKRTRCVTSVSGMVFDNIITVWSPNQNLFTESSSSSLDNPSKTASMLFTITN